ncbi:restriction endonuclease subunit S [Corynebacterium sp. 153RC1]|uniref:restriction endonuclease subunit S n=1 Tax=unclassified Corynebacterium TaxID=2624378 RepID=UPI00211C0F42|nr:MULTISPECIES: restriction endonuclease subunit S [unclassified Corynebacterium]MCQ9351899.1 restriction endonuclease subunit S [Corynebacterium sp. 209RC1]MCQ9355056.1 restriction endonuclease subunit S [Corynebacterium sp. 1222RC1]MCQ9356181.1 restriction endonuclease subunit S [Corynebacterium sp. 122RC1]MCQ9359576.1 restriction endonuclease subunit S [Corynebacterium sp. 142RC1]MCQ9360795.1 restriction endonuclease subunit S [Corynebacterium sp. 153RC1]
MLDTSNWEFFLLNRICSIDMGSKMDFSAMSTENPSVNFVGRSAENNGVMGKVDLIDGVAPYPAGSLTVALGGSLGSTFLQTDPFYTSQNVSVLSFDENEVSPLARLFLASMIHFEARFKYFPFGRELNKYLRTVYGFDLPVKRDGLGKPVIDPSKRFHNEGYIPDWQYMERFIRNLNSKPISTANTTSKASLNTRSWVFFLLKDLCSIDMGSKMDLSAMSADNPTVNFVGRSAENNGVVGVVDCVEDIDPYPAGSLTVALGGSLGSTFYQAQPFYTAQNVSVLQFDTEQVSPYARLFLATMIEFESRFKYSPFGRELNKYIRTIYGFELPVQRDENGCPVIDPAKTYHPEGFIPDWEFMENYIRSLPYGDRIPESKGSHTRIEGE